MSAVRTAALAILLVSAACLGTAAAIIGPGEPGTDIDPTIRPGDDFYRYANGGWLRSVAAQPGQPADTRTLLNQRAREQVRALIEAAAAAQAPRGSVTRKVGDYYASFLDTDAIEAKGLAPLAAERAAIARIRDVRSLSAYLGSTLNSEVDGVTANADHVFGVWVNQGFEDSRHNLPHIWQGGLGLPDRESYLDPSPKSAALRDRYTAHVAAVLSLAGAADAQDAAARVVALEVRLAQAHAPDSDAADVSKQNNPWTRADFTAKAPGIDWNAYFRAAGMTAQRDFLVWQPSAVTGTAALVAGESVAVWQAYLTVHLFDHYAAVLPRAVAAEHFAFYGGVLAGASQPPERSEDAIAATNGALGMAVGRLYAQRYFPPAAKARANAMGADLIAAFRARIERVAWMSPATKQKALAKLAAFRLGLGYPDVWTDYAALDVVRGDALGNLRRAEAFNRARNLVQLRQPVDPVAWPLLPQVPGAFIMFSPNAEYFAAAILQPPFFDPAGDNASNYGSAGAGMAHEISHSFDDLGHIYDAEGRLRDWWTADDASRFHATAARLAGQLGADCPLPGLCVNGKQVQTESVADLAGLLVAHDAYILSLKGKPDVVIGGLSGEQRFFLAFAQRWRKTLSEDALRRQIASDSHLPPEYRSDAVRNVDAWYDAFGVKPGDKLYLKPEDRSGIW